MWGAHRPALADLGPHADTPAGIVFGLRLHEQRPRPIQSLDGLVMAQHETETDRRDPAIDAEMADQTRTPMPEKIRFELIIVRLREEQNTNRG